MKTYKGYKIEEKMDFGKNTGSGFVITKNSVNIMPGATWALDVKEAHLMIDIYEKSDGVPEMFWKLWKCYRAIANNFGVKEPH
jgi:hypothetical protein